MISRSLEISLNLAVKTAQEKGHEYVGVEHILYALLQNPDAERAIKACGGSIELTKKDLERYFEEKLETHVLPRGTAPQPTLGFQRVLQLAAQQVIAAGKDKIYGDTVLVALFSEKESFAVYFLEKQNITRFDLINFISHGVVKEGADIDYADRDDFDGPARLNPATNKQGGADDDDRSHAKKDKKRAKNDPLSLYTTNLCDKARRGEIDPLIGREDELARTVQVLCRRRKNNPLYVGDSGVGKTALAEGLAKRIVEGEVPAILQESEVYSLEMGTLLAGTKFRGDFEQRLKGLIHQIKKQKNAILFIDEIHTIIGAGAVSGGSLDASNILKPFLSSGEIRCIGSTTYKEFRQHVENDHALTRRFQKIAVEEPSVDDTIKILKGLKDHYESYHGVHYSLEAIKGAAELSHVHLKDRKLPDKAIDILDEAGASFVARGMTRDPAVPHHIGLAEIKVVVAKMARIPADRLSSADKNALRNLGESLRQVVFGQDKAVTVLERAIRMSRSGLGREDKPIGSFLFSGPTGVGKTELAKQLAKLLGISFIRFDMSEYMERHAVSRLIGAPPGYVGYDEGGLLTDGVHQNPHSVLLLDEIEKAHPDVHNVLLQVMDHGTLTDTNGRQTDFRNVIIIMTTNVGASELARGTIGFNKGQDAAEGKDQNAIKQAFSPEFRNRIDAMVSFKPLPEEVMEQIVDKFLKEIEPKLQAKRVKWQVSAEARRYLARIGYDPAYGARPLGRVIQDKVKTPLADEILFGKLARGGKLTIDYDAEKDEITFRYH